MTADLQPLQRGIMANVRQVGDVARARPEAFEERLQSRADELSRAALYQSTADLLVTALHRCIDAAFEHVGTLPVGMDPDGRILVVTPWSKRSHHQYGLKRHQCDLLRVIVENWQTAHAAGQFKTAPVFVRDDLSGKWYCNVSTYQTADTAHKALGRWLTPEYVRKVELSVKQSSTKAGTQPQRTKGATGA